MGGSRVWPPSRRRTRLEPCGCADLPWRPYTRGWSPSPAEQCRGVTVQGLLSQGGELPLVSHRQPSAPHHHQRGQGFIARESSVINGDIRLHKEKLLDGMEIKSH